MQYQIFAVGTCVNLKQASSDAKGQLVRNCSTWRGTNNKAWLEGSDGDPFGNSNFLLAVMSTFPKCGGKYARQDGVYVISEPPTLSEGLLAFCTYKVRLRLADDVLRASFTQCYQLLTTETVCGLHCDVYAHSCGIVLWRTH